MPGKECQWMSITVLGLQIYSRKPLLVKTKSTSGDLRNNFTQGSISCLDLPGVSIIGNPGIMYSFKGFFYMFGNRVICGMNAVLTSNNFDFRYKLFYIDNA